MITFFLLALIQDSAIVTGQKAVLDQMSADMTAEIQRCGIKATFFIPRGKSEIADAKAVLEPGATAEQVKCAKDVVSWLASDAEARTRGWK